MKMQTPEPCLCGATDCPKCYRNATSREVSDDDRADACDAITEEVLDTGKFPQAGRTEVDLYEFVTEELDSSFAYELVVAALGNNKLALEARIERLYDKVQAMLKKHLDDSDCVEEMAQDICDDRGQI
jgi:hypothetical protein